MKIQFTLLLLVSLFLIPLSSCKKEVEQGEIRVNIHKLTNCNFASQMYVTVYKDGNTIATQSLNYDQNGDNTLNFGSHDYGVYAVKAAVAKSCWTSHYEEIESSVQITLDKSTVFADIWVQ